MAQVNEHYQKLRAGYLFPEIKRRTEAFQEAHPEAAVIKLGIGDVTLPLAPAVVEALHRAVDEMGSAEGFRGYGPEQGYPFLREAIREHDFGARGVEIAADEIFVSSGSKEDCGNVQEIFGQGCRVLVTDPVYPVYVDTNVMAGRTGPADEAGRFEGIAYVAGSEADGFSPEPPAGETADLVYLCSPNNPTGSVLTRERMAQWVAWARERDAVILFDAAYDAFVADPALPRSIYEVDGARECAIEMRSFSKRAGFTGLRCAYTVVPKELAAKTSAGERVALHGLWSRRHATKTNGVPYIAQRAAEAVFSPEGRKQTGEQIDYYRENARRIREGLAQAGFHVFAGEHAPYIWFRGPAELSSWELFDRMLERAHVVGTPGSGFGPAGEGYFRLSAFNSRENVDEALERIRRGFAG